MSDKMSTVVINDYDSQLHVGSDGTTCSSFEGRWFGGRASQAVRGGKYYFEVTLVKSGPFRSGWSLSSANLQLGKDPHGFALTNTGKKYSNNKEEKYAKAVEEGNVVSCFIDLDQREISYSLNGESLGIAFRLPDSLAGKAFFPAVAVKNSEVSINFGLTPFAFDQSSNGFVAISQAQPEHIVFGAAGGQPDPSPDGVNTPDAGGGDKQVGGPDAYNKTREQKPTTKPDKKQESNSQRVAQGQGGRGSQGGRGGRGGVPQSSGAVKGGPGAPTTSAPASSSTPGAGGGAGSPLVQPPHPQAQAQAQARLKMFDHLVRDLEPTSPFLIRDKKEEVKVHPAIAKLKELTATGVIREDDDRVVALLEALIDVIGDYSTPPGKNLSWELDKHIKAQVQVLEGARQLSLGMVNLRTHLSACIHQVPRTSSEDEAKKLLVEGLEAFLDLRILYARDSIVRKCTSLFRDEDVVMTFGSSPTIRQVLVELAATTKFRLVVVDARPLNDGLATLAALSPLVQCVYTPLAGAAAAMRGVTRVLLGASALLSNGAMLAPAGSAMVAAIAKAHRVPVVVAAESYKFSDRVQLDSIVYNELGSVDEVAVVSSEVDPKGPSTGAITGTSVLVHVSPQEQSQYRGAYVSPSNSVGGQGRGMPQIVNLRYDLTPMKNISVVATEVGLIPPTSIPVVMGEYRAAAEAGADRASHAAASSSGGQGAEEGDDEDEGGDVEEDS